MEIREDFLEGDDLDIRKASLKGAKNMRGLVTRAAEARPGTLHVRKMNDAEQIIEISSKDGTKYCMGLKDDRLQIVDETGSLVRVFTNVPWANASSVWVSSFRGKTIIGGHNTGLSILEGSGSTWTISDFTYWNTAGGEIAQPYWAYHDDVTIRPSATSGTVIVTASKPIWNNKYIGQRIRYGDREIRLTSRTNQSIMVGKVVSKLPPSFNLGVEDGSVFRVGEAVVGADTNFQGLIVNIVGATLQVVTTSFFEGPDVGEEIAGPAGSSILVARVEISPLASPIWDEPLMSPYRGYPRAAGKVAGRLVLLDFKAVPDLVVLSSARSIQDFKTGANDADAIVRQVGDGAPRWLHAVNMGDLLLFSDNGVYNVPARENGVISPSTFDPVLIDDIGASEISPVKVDDGVVFVDASGEGVSAAFLDGNVYLKWSIRSLTTFHSHLVKNPVALCGPALRSRAAEKYMFIVNSDGSLAAISWRESMRDEAVGFAPWSTRGSFKHIAPMFDGYWALVDRTIDGTKTRFLEKFDDSAYVDCAVVSTDTTDEQYLTGNGDFITANGDNLVVIPATAKHLAGATASYYARGWDVGDFVVEKKGTIDTVVGVPGEFQIGFNFVATMGVWPVEAIESPRIGTLSARVMQIIVSVHDTLGYEVRCNKTTRKVDPYRVGDDVTKPPKPRTEIRRFAVYGNRDHPEMEVIKRRPGPFRVLAIGQRVQG